MIQERAFLSALLPPERLLALDHGDYKILSSEHLWKLRTMAEVPKVAQAICSEDDFLLHTFLMKKKSMRKD